MTDHNSQMNSICFSASCL